MPRMWSGAMRWTQRRGPPMIFSNVCHTNPWCTMSIPAFRVIVGHGAYEHELYFGDFFFYGPVDVYNPQRILPGIKARDLNDKGTFRIDTELESVPE